MYFAVALTSYGHLQLVGKPQETKEAVIENFAGAWAEFNTQSSYLQKEVKHYGIAQVIDGVEMTHPPQFAVVPFMAALPKPVEG